MITMIRIVVVASWFSMFVIEVVIVVVTAICCCGSGCQVIVVRWTQAAYADLKPEVHTITNP